MAAQAVSADAFFGTPAPASVPLTQNQGSVSVASARPATPAELGQTTPSNTVSADDFFSGGEAAPQTPSIYNGFAGLASDPSNAPQLKAPMVDTGPLGAVSAAVRGAANTITGGWADKAAAFASSVPSLFGGDFNIDYSKNLDREQATTSQSQGFHPIAYAGGSAPGAVAQGLLLPEARGAGMIAQGAGLGFMNGTGQARGDISTVAQQGLLPAAEGAGFGLLAHGVLGNTPAVPARLPAYDRVGVDPSLAVNGGSGIQRISQTIKGVPFVGTPLVKAAERTAHQLDSGIMGTADRLGPTGDHYASGSSLQTGALEAVKGMKTTADRLYAPINDLENVTVSGGPRAPAGPPLKSGGPVDPLLGIGIPGGGAQMTSPPPPPPGALKIPMSSTSRAIDGINAQFPNMPGWIKQTAPTVSSLQDTLQAAGGNLTLRESRALKTDIGMQMSNPNLSPTDKARLATVYAGLSSDIRSGVGASAYQDAINKGLPQTAAQHAAARAQQGLDRADTYYAAAQQRTTDALAPLIGRGANLSTRELGDNAPAAEAAYGRVLAAAQGGSRADLATVGQIKRSLDPDAWNGFTSGVISTMGRGADGSFNPAAFATAYSKLTPEGRAAVFGRGGLSHDMDAFAQIAADQKAASKFYNHSNSGHAGIVGAGIMEVGQHIAETGIAGLGSLLTGAVPAYLAARVLASPGLARTMLKASRAHPGAADGLFQSYIAAHPSAAPYINAVRAKTSNIATSGIEASPIARRQPAPQLSAQ